MASIKREITTAANPDRVWDAIRDVGALHTRLVPGFVIDTQLESNARIVTFRNGMIVKEPIVTVDHTARRLVWCAIGGALTHYNGVVQVFDEPEGGSRIVWTADLLPEAAAAHVSAMMEEGIAVMKITLDRIVD